MLSASTEGDLEFMSMSRDLRTEQNSHQHLHHGDSKTMSGSIEQLMFSIESTSICKHHRQVPQHDSCSGSPRT